MRTCGNFKAGQSLEVSTGITLNYESEGHGERAVVYLHGFGASIRNWDDIRGGLPSGWRHFFVDFRGSGFSTRRAGMSYSVEEHAKDIVGFIRAQRLEQVVLVGHSYGGAISLLVLRELERLGEEGRVRGLILINSAGYAAADTYPLYHLRTPLWGAFVVNVVPPRLQARSTLERAFMDKRRITSELLDRYTCFYRDPVWREALIAAAREAEPPDAEVVREWFGTIKVPTLILWGGGDRIIPVEHAKRFSAAIRGSAIEVLEGVGHVPQEERPDAVRDKIAQFLGELNER